MSDERSDLFGRNEWNPLETDVVIIDEMSMVDIFPVSYTHLDVYKRQVTDSAVLQNKDHQQQESF